MRVVIVGKTVWGDRNCIGAVEQSRTYRSLRLLDANGQYPRSPKYEVGDIWDVSFTEPDVIEKPHVENVHVHSATRIDSINELESFLSNLVTIWTGSIDGVFEGKLEYTGSGHGYIGKGSVPKMSTGFWRPDKDLTFAEKYYRYDYREIKYTGSSEPIGTIPSGTLVRLSLATWWKPNDADEDLEKRCYLQLSGWYG